MKRALRKLFFLNDLRYTKWQIKLLFAAIAFTIIVTVMWFTWSIVDDLISREQRIIQLYAEIYKHFTHSWSEDTDNINIDDYLFFIDEITPSITFPVIVTDQDDKPFEPFDTWSLNVEIDTSLSLQKQREFMTKYVISMQENYTPIIITEGNENEKILAKFYYTHASLIDRLRYFPIIAIVVVAIFVIIAYWAFSSFRKNEQSRVWVGMSKEAAHQLGTPLSSLLAWMEILKYSESDPDSIKETIKEMESDVNRLNIIATRFSKIGSTPEKMKQDMAVLVENVSSYFEKRLPHLGKKVQIIRNIPEGMIVFVNPDLFTWVIENLLKNAAEAIEEKKGLIEIFLDDSNEKSITILLKDTGKGMTSKLKHQVFSPGFTTKKRGWGPWFELV
jgi:two-component system, sporulation sensor kinase D